MNEHEPHMPPEKQPGAERGAPDWRRLDVVRTRWFDRVADGIAEAMTTHSDINLGTARAIAHVLGRSYARDSALADFARTGEGDYLTLRDEYLDLYGDAQADAITKEWIDWLGTYLVQRESLGSGRRFMNEHLPPKLDRLLVRTKILVHDQPFTVHLPASLDSDEIAGLREELTTLRLDEDEALQAFVSLPDVDANTPMLMESFHESFVGRYSSPEDVVHWVCEIEDWDTEVREYAAERGLLVDGLTPNYPQLLDKLSGLYDLVDWKGYTYVFYK